MPADFGQVASQSQGKNNSGRNLNDLIPDSHDQEGLLKEYGQGVGKNTHCGTI